MHMYLKFSLFYLIFSFLLNLANKGYMLSVGVMVTKAMTSVTKEISRQFLINKVLPAIKEKWPAEERGMPIFIQ